MAVNATLTDLYFKIEGVDYRVASISEADKSKIAQAVQDVTNIKQQLESLDRGQITLVDVDPSIEDNLENLPNNVFLWAPCNATGQFVKIDLTTGQAATEQADGVEDTEIAQYKVYIKTAQGTANLIRTIKAQPDFAQFAGVDKANTFSQTQKITAAQNWDSADGDEVAKVSSVKAAITAAQTKISYSETVPESLTENAFVATPAQSFIS